MRTQPCLSVQQSAVRMSFVRRRFPGKRVVNEPYSVQGSGIEYWDGSKQNLPLIQSLRSMTVAAVMEIQQYTGTGCVLVLARQEKHVSHLCGGLLLLSAFGTIFIPIVASKTFQVRREPNLRVSLRWEMTISYARFQVSSRARRPRYRQSSLSQSNWKEWAGKCGDLLSSKLHADDTGN